MCVTGSPANSAFRERGPIAVKGKGEQLTWFLEGAATATAPG